MNLHRNNAAEWVMWVFLLPAFAVAIVMNRLRPPQKKEDSPQRH